MNSEGALRAGIYSKAQRAFLLSIRYSLLSIIYYLSATSLRAIRGAFSMKTVINQIPDKANELVTIDCCEITQEIINLRDHAESVGDNISCMVGGKSVILPLSDILYFEAVDEKVFAYTESDVADVRGRLYEYEERLADKGFARVSKSVLVHIIKIKGIAPSPGRKFEAELCNGERVIISRQYAADLKKILLGGKINEL